LNSKGRANTKIELTFIICASKKDLWLTFKIHSIIEKSVKTGLTDELETI